MLLEKAASAAAYRTIAYAVEKADASSTIIVNAGTYYETSAIDIRKSPTLKNNGDAQSFSFFLTAQWVNIIMFFKLLFQIGNQFALAFDRDQAVSHALQLGD